MSDADAQKTAAAARAVALIESGMRVGLGTGSTARHVVELLAAALRKGALHNVVCVPTSRATEKQARELEVPLATLDSVTHLDLTIDGTDEVTPQLDLVKGLGGALLWEKIVARASARLVIVADESKEVARLGTRAPLPVEVVPFGWRTHIDTIEALGARPVLRGDKDGAFVTDGGHYILDLHFENGITDASALEDGLRARPGVVASGLFLGMADTVFIGTADGVRTLTRAVA